MNDVKQEIIEQTDKNLRAIHKLIYKIYVAYRQLLEFKTFFSNIPDSYNLEKSQTIKEIRKDSKVLHEIAEALDEQISEPVAISKFEAYDLWDLTETLENHMNDVRREIASHSKKAEEAKTQKKEGRGR